VSDSIRIDSASTNNLKELSCELPRGSIVGVTGPSGSGKSSLVFGTLWREARRRLLAPVFASAEALLDPPAPVRGITGLSFPVALFPGRAGRSYLPSVATLGGFFDDLSELFLHFGQAHCVRCDAALDEHTRKSIADSLELSGAERAAVLIPVAGCDANARVEAARSYLAKGFTRAYVGGEYLELEQLLPAENEEVGVLVDAIKLSTGGFRPRLFEALAIALRYSPRALLVGEVSGGSNVNYWFSPKAYCGECGNVQASRDPELFDYYKRRSACEGCLGSGVQASPAQNSVFDVTVPLLKGGVLPWRARTLLPSSAELLRWKRSLKLKGTTMLSDLAPQLQFRALFGAAGTTRFPVFGLSPRSAESDLLTSGIAGTLVARYRSAHDPALRKTLARFIEVTECAMCCGARVRAEVGARRIFGRSFSEVLSSTISDVAAWLDAVSSEYTKGSEIRARLLRRLRGLEKLGIGYLTPSRAARTLSGGEYQRVEIARELDSPLAGVLYLLDEPSVGLHPLDSRRLAAELAGLKAHDATVVVVDHDAEVLRACDMILELGPAGGACGGEILFQGTSGEYFSKRRPKGVMRTADSPRPSGQKLTATGLAMRNLRGIALSIPCGALVGICGVSGSGKSTALFECLAPALEALISRRRRSNKAGGSPALTADEKRRWCISEVRG
jgi:excinuclease ABC subunit A